MKACCTPRVACRVAHSPAARDLTKLRRALAPVLAGAVMGVYLLWLCGVGR